MASSPPRPNSLLDRRFTLMLIWERRQLDEAAKAGDEAKAMQQRRKVGHLSDLLALRRSFTEQQRFDDASTANFLREQLDCLQKLTAEMGCRRRKERPGVQSCGRPRAAGLESFRSMREEIEAIERDAVNDDIDRIAERMEGLLNLLID